MEKDSYTLSELVAATGAKRRAAQVWAERGVLKTISGTDSAGSGTHRRFAHQEVEIAATLVPLSQMGVPIGHLGRVATHLRKLRLWTHRGSEQANEDLAIVERARRGKGENYMFFADIGAKRPKVEFWSGEEGVVNIRLPSGASSGILIDLNEAWKNLAR